jgi:hypothetical protein
MALWFALRVNDTTIGDLVIRRLHDLDQDDPENTVSDYEVLHNGDAIGTVQHRYGDGAWVLVQKAVGMVNGPAPGQDMTLSYSYRRPSRNRTTRE